MRSVNDMNELEGTTNKGVWSEDEHERFLRAMLHFTSWKEVAEMVGTRSEVQCRSHNQKMQKKKKNREEGRGRLTRREHRLPTENVHYGSTPASPVGVEGGLELTALSFPLDEDLNMELIVLSAQDNLIPLDPRVGDLSDFFNEFNSLMPSTSTDLSRM